MPRVHYVARRKWSAVGTRTARPFNSPKGGMKEPQAFAQGSLVARRKWSAVRTRTARPFNSLKGGMKEPQAFAQGSLVARRGLEAAFESNTLEQSRTEWPLVYSDVANTPASSHRPGRNRHVRQIPTNYLLK